MKRRLVGPVLLAALLLGALSMPGLAQVRAGLLNIVSQTTGTLTVGRGGTGATSLTGVVVGNGTGTMTTVAAPAGTIVGTTDTQTLSNKTLADPTITGVTASSGRVSVLSGGNAVSQLNTNATVSVASTGYFGVSAGSSANTGVDTILARDGAGIFAQRNGTNPQAFRGYNTYTDASNYERVALGWSSNLFVMGTERGGTGAARGFTIRYGGTTTPALAIPATSGAITIAGGGAAAETADLDVAGRIRTNGLYIGGGTGNFYGTNGTMVGPFTSSQPNGFVFGYTNSAPHNVGVASSLSFGFMNSDGTSHLSRWWYGGSAGVIDQRDGTTANEYRVTGRYVSDTDRQYVAIKHAVATLSAVSGASVTSSGLIPAGAIVVGITTRVTAALGTGSGTTGYQVGDGSDADRWGTKTGTAIGTKTQNSDWTTTAIPLFNAAQDVVVTANGGNFNGTGTIVVDVAYLAGFAD